MKLFKTKYIIAPYKENPKYWTDLIMRFSAYCVRVYDGKCEDYRHIIIENCHATVEEGGYGDDSIPAERKAGMKQTLLKLEKIASEKQNELVIITRNDGTVSSGITEELKLWSDTREITWAQGTQFLTISQVEEFLKMEARLRGKQKSDNSKTGDLCYWCSKPDLLRKQGKLDTKEFCSPECEQQYKER